MLAEEGKSSDLFLRQALTCFQRAGDDGLRMRAAAQIELEALRKYAFKNLTPLEELEFANIVHRWLKVSISFPVQDLCDICEMLSPYTCQPTYFQREILAILKSR